MPFFGALTVPQIFPTMDRGQEEICFFFCYQMKNGNLPDADGQFNNSVNWYFNDDKLHFDNNSADDQNQNFGSAVGRSSLRLFFAMHKLWGNPELMFIVPT